MGLRIWNRNTAKMCPGYTKKLTHLSTGHTFNPFSLNVLILFVYVTFHYSQLVLQVMANGSGERKRPAEESNGAASAKKPR
jgi:hypothetical protein